jgi:hypothetical protein
MLLLVLVLVVLVPITIKNLSYTRKTPIQKT